MMNVDWAANRARFSVELGLLPRQKVVRLLQFDPVVILPVGALEQHGEHLPLDTDGFLVTQIAAAAAEQAHQKVATILAPAVSIGYSPHHMHYSGTVTLSSGTLIALIQDIVRSLSRHGFRRVLILNGHGGNSAPLSVAASELRAGDVMPVVATADYWNLIADSIAQERESGIGGMGHAGEFETSLMLHLRPTTVDRERMVRTVHTPRVPDDSLDLLQKAPFSIPWVVHRDTPNGVIGDPFVASAEKGRRFFEAAVVRAAQLVGDLQQMEIGE